MASNEVHIVTGGFGYTGKHIVRQLLEKGKRVYTLTNSPLRENPFNGKVKAFPYHFNDQAKLVQTLKSADILYNTYWVRFNHKDFSHEEAVVHSLKLIRAAKQAGIKRMVHVSITNPDVNSPYEYFSGKARIENALVNSGLSYSILRPAVIFGKDDILINNITWVLRKFPLFGVFGSGEYRMQPIFVEDFAELAIKQGSINKNSIIDAIGPETFTFNELIKTIAAIIGKKRFIISVPPIVASFVGKVIGMVKGDVFLTRAEIDAFMQDLLFTGSRPTGKTKLTTWLKENMNEVGLSYKSELKRRRQRTKKYSDL